MPLFRRPVVFQEAVATLAAKRDRPTALKTAQIAALWDSEAKRRAFFSARVAAADVLAQFHQRVSQVMQGLGTDAQARELLFRWLQGEGAGALAELGFSPPNIDGGVADLASVRRLDLILYQNTKMAAEVGAYRQWSESRDVYPYGRWHIGYSRVHRDAHLQRDGMVFAFDHPVWTEDPPGGLFNCHCWREELTAAQVRDMGLQPQADTYEFVPSPLGFDPSKGLDQPLPERETWSDELKAKIRAALAS